MIEKKIGFLRSHSVSTGKLRKVLLPHWICPLAWFFLHQEMRMETASHRCCCCYLKFTVSAFLFMHLIWFFTFLLRALFLFTLCLCRSSIEPSRNTRQVYLFFYSRLIMRNQQTTTALTRNTNSISVYFDLLSTWNRFIDFSSRRL